MGRMACPRGDPAFLGEPLALGAVPVTAGVVAGILLLPAGKADALVPTQGGGPAKADGRQGAALDGGQGVGGLQIRPEPPHDVPQVVGGAGHAARLRRGEIVEWTRKLSDQGGGNMQVNLGGL